MSKHYVYSTLSSDTAYTVYTKSENDLPIRERAVVIKGGSNVADKNFITPRGVVTAIDEKDYADLKENSVFQLHVDGGFIAVETTKPDAEIVAADMTGRDASAPLVPEDYEVPTAKDGAKPHPSSQRKHKGE